MNKFSNHIYLSISPISRVSVSQYKIQEPLMSFLAEDQHNRLEKMTNLIRREEFLGVRSILFELYQKYELCLGQSSTSQAVKLTQDEFGRPYLMQARVSLRANEGAVKPKPKVQELQNDSLPSVSLSHTKQLLAAVISDQSRIGIDIEIPIRTVSEALKRRFFNQQEIQEGIFYDHPVWLWVIKEAVVKCIGMGIQADLTKIVVRIVDANTRASENWSIERHPSMPKGEEREYLFYASYSTKEWFEGKLWSHPSYVCAIAIPSLNIGGNSE